MSKSNLSRRDFLKLGFLGLTSLAFNPFPIDKDDYTYPGGEVGRVTVFNKISVYKEPNWDSPIIGYLNTKDTLVNIYYEEVPSSGPAYNPHWYRVWDGFIHSAYIQKVKIRFNEVLSSIPEQGQLCEVTVPYSQIYKYSPYHGWERFNRLYYETTHWVVGIDEGPDGAPWYRINDNGLEFQVPASHLRPVPNEEFSPITPEIPWEGKRIEVSIQEQTLTAFEYNQPVFKTKISSGLHLRPDPNDIPWDTPKGDFFIQNKQPSTHMGEGNLTGDPEAYELPGVPWTLYFEPETGVAFHGAYWHNNFGLQMSHGCVNMRPKDARWLFRWSYPIFEVPIKDRSGWEKRGRGTPVKVI
jgi:hypothetical protein